MLQDFDVFEKYYSFSKLDITNNYYLQKKENYLKAKNAYFSNQAEANYFPLRTTIQTTDFCNLNCIMCQIHSEEEKHTLQQMTEKNFDIIVQKLFPTLVEVHPTNIGEPMISPWFDYLCKKCIEYGVLLDITSNGTLMTEDKIRQLLPCLLDIKISYDGIKKETFEKIRCGANFDVVNENIKNFLAIRKQENYKGTISLQMTLFDFNYKELPAIIRYAAENGIDRVKAFHVFSYSPEIDNVSLVKKLDLFEETRQQSLELAKKLGIKADIAEGESKNPQKDTESLLKQKCRLPWAEAFIDYDGSLYPCHTHNHKAYGNIFKQNVKDVWDSTYAQYLRDCLINGKTDNTICNNCGNNFIRTDREQDVPYNKNDFLYEKTDDKNINWGKRCKQFLLNR